MLRATLYFILFLFIFVSASADAKNTQTFPLVYRIDLNKVSKSDVLKAGTVLNAVLLEDVGAGSNENQSVNFYLPVNEGEGIRIIGIISKSNNGGRFSKYSKLKFSTDELYLNDGRNIKIHAVSPDYSAVHPPHLSSNVAGIANVVTTLTVGASPLTLGASLGAGFLVNGLLSARQNGISDFVWGGLSGSRLSFVERLFRKQPDVYLAKGEYVPFLLEEDLKISNGIQCEKIKTENVDDNYSIYKIQELLEWGDLAGALEYSIRTGQVEIYEKLLQKVSG